MKISKGSKTIDGIPTTLQVAVPVLVQKQLSSKKVWRIESLTRHVRLQGMQYKDKRGTVWATYTRENGITVTPPFEEYSPEKVAEAAA